MMPPQNKLIFSIITPSLNRAGFIAKAIESVQAQDYPFVEHIIMDGGSTDGTIELLARYPHLRVISHKDKGMYDAINQGIEMANGEIIGLLNTDDYYEPSVFSVIARSSRDNPLASAVCGRARSTKLTAAAIIDRGVFPGINQANLLYFVTLGAPIINAWFFRRTVFNKIGLFNLDYPIAADRDFMIRFASAEEQFISIDQVVYVYQIHPGALTMNDNPDCQASFLPENLKISEKYLALKTIHPDLKKHLKTWHSKITKDQFISALGKRDFGLSINHARRGLSHNFAWPIIVIKNMLKRMYYFVSRG